MSKFKIGLLLYRVAISLFARLLPTIRCQALGGYQNVVTKVFWLEHINTDVKAIVKSELIRHFVL